ncbi:tRNA lysidine(34) synthetase TilS [Thiorhodospira sibirica]|uniref:tRNA lysidine(34) synthetase TilS n=1 Tax=Thiorhodospira sibirica TaxID=154347 RepID=UPI001FE2D5DE|nr:tRNA lysidine(34) synthetase TilS [Thiorhodospira sibirica]
MPLKTSMSACAHSAIVQTVQQQLVQNLRRYPPTRHYCLAYSGGLDSHVLLHAMQLLAQHDASLSLQAVHIHHGLNPQADHWVEHCQQICAALEVPLTVQRINARPSTGYSLEDFARRQRYQLLAKALPPGAGLLLAQHQDDQAETLLLQLLRGAGLAGLASMAPWQPFAQGFMARPWLEVSRSTLAQYAHTHQLRWIEDDSNQDTRFDRNYLRHEILPRLQQRFPGTVATLARAAKHQAQAQDLLGELARRDLDSVRALTPGQLSIAGLRLLKPARQVNALRYWLHEKGLPMPPQARLHSGLAQLLTARHDASPHITWEGAELRRYRDTLYAMPPLAPHDPRISLPWDGQSVLRLETLNLCLTPAELPALTPPLRPDETLWVRFRQGGETLPWQGHTQSLKKRFQAAGIPPWERERIPLIYRGECLIYVRWP